MGGWVKENSGFLLSFLAFVPQIKSVQRDFHHAVGQKEITVGNFEENSRGC